MHIKRLLLAVLVGVNVVPSFAAQCFASHTVRYGLYSEWLCKELSVSEEELLNRFQLPTSIAKYAEQQKDAIINHCNDVDPDETNKKGLVIDDAQGSPLAVCKRFEIKRAVNAARAQACIDDHAIKGVNIPQKWIYPINDSDGRKHLVAFAEYIVDHPKYKASKEATRGLIQFVEKTRYNDAHKDNIFVKENGDLWIIDIDSRAFSELNASHILVKSLLGNNKLDTEEVKKALEGIPVPLHQDTKYDEQIFAKEKNLSCGTGSAVGA